ncbi:MAG: YceD family protein [Gallionella sp.]
MHARPFIDSLDFARNGQRITGEILVNQLPRLSDVFESKYDLLHYSVIGKVGLYGIPQLDLQLSGAAQMICQRCLHGMEYKISVSNSIFLRTQVQLNELDDSDIEEEYESILAEAQLDVWQLLEEEILLSLPIAPKHLIGECQTVNGSQPQQKESHPFAALAKLKR